MNGLITNIGIRSIDILISVKFKRQNDTIYQRFTFSNLNKRNSKYVKDKRFEAYDRVQDKITQYMLSNLFNDKVQFSLRAEEEKSITFSYKIINSIDNKCLENYYFVVPSFVPPDAGCKYCVHYGDDKICNVRNKTYLQPLKNCVVFKQKAGLFKT